MNFPYIGIVKSKIFEGHPIFQRMLICVRDLNVGLITKFALKIHAILSQCLLDLIRSN